MFPAQRVSPQAMPDVDLVVIHRRYLQGLAAVHGGDRRARAMSALDSRPGQRDVAWLTRVALSAIRGRLLILELSCGRPRARRQRADVDHRSVRANARRALIAPQT